MRVELDRPCGIYLLIFTVFRSYFSTLPCLEYKKRIQKKKKIILQGVLKCKQFPAHLF